MRTYQDWLEAKEAGKITEFIRDAITEYMNEPDYKIALDADEYEAERNTTILRFTKMLYNSLGQAMVDFTATNTRIASNFLHRLTTQRISYSLGNGISFPTAHTVIEDNKVKIVDETKQKLGKNFDTVLYRAARYALLHKVSFLFWNLDHATFFKMTEFMPIFDEDDGLMKVGFRFWSLDWNKRPVTVVVYEEDGYTEYRTRKGYHGLTDLVESKPKRAYKQTLAKAKVDKEATVVSESNYSALPIIPFWGNEHKQSDLVGMKAKIDTFDLVKSGFADDVEQCQEIFWIIENALGMTDDAIEKFRDKIKLQKMAVIDAEHVNLKPYQQEIPVNARDTLLKSIREQIYEDYGALDVHTVAAGSTNDHIDMAYQSMDDEADDFEYQVMQAVQGVLEIIGIEDVPIFSRNKVSNQKERTQMINDSADHLDEETILRKYPFLSPDEVEQILARKSAEDTAAFSSEE